MIFLSTNIGMSKLLLQKMINFKKRLIINNITYIQNIINKHSCNSISSCEDIEKKLLVYIQFKMKEVISISINFMPFLFIIGWLLWIG